MRAAYSSGRASERVLWVLWGPSLFGADKTNADYAFSSTWLKALHYGSVIRGGQWRDDGMGQASMMEELAEGET